MQIANIDQLQILIGKQVRFLAQQTSAHMSSSGNCFVGTHTLSIPLADFSFGRSYKSDFIEISSDWHQSRLGDDYHMLTIQRVSKPSDAGEPIAVPHKKQSPFVYYPHFYGEYLNAPITCIEVFERLVRTEIIDGSEAEEIVYDSHVRFLAGEYAVILTTEHGSILGEIEIHAVMASNTTLLSEAHAKLRIIIK